MSIKASLMILIARPTMYIPTDAGYISTGVHYENETKIDIVRRCLGIDDVRVTSKQDSKSQYS